MKTLLSLGSFIGSIRKEDRAGDFSFAEVLDCANEEIPQHTHEEPHFLLVLSGGYITSARNVDKICSPSTVIFNPAGTTHRDRFYDRGGRFFSVSLSAANFNRLQNSPAALDYPAGFVGGNELSWLAAKLYREFKTQDMMSPLVTEGIALELLGYTLRQEIGTEKAMPMWLRTACELLNDCCTEPITVGAIATTVGVHPFHLTRTFRRFFHCSPAEYLRKIRIEKASRFLQNSSQSLVEIALSNGFSDQSQFTKCFKRVTGLTPGEYRRTFS